jgi:hypothetical protein
LGSCFFNDDVVISQSAAPTAILFSNVNPQKTGLAHGIPQLNRFGMAFDHVLKIRASETAHQFGHAVAQHRVVICCINQSRTKNN